MTVEAPPRETVPLDRLTPHPRNYKRHPPDQLEHIVQSIREHGVYKNVVVARDYTILAGHGVVEAAALVPLAEIEVAVLDVAADDPQAIKIVVGDNEIGNLAELDDRLLTEHLKALVELDDLLGTGYDAMMLAGLVLITRPESEIATIDHAAEWAGMPAFETFEAPYKVVVSFDNPEDREKFLEQSGIAVINRKDRETWSVRWPPREKEDLASVFIEPS